MALVPLISVVYSTVQYVQCCTLLVYRACVYSIVLYTELYRLQLVFTFQDAKSVGIIILL